MRQHSKTNNKTTKYEQLGLKNMMQWFKQYEKSLQLPFTCKTFARKMKAWNDKHLNDGASTTKTQEQNESIAQIATTMQEEPKKTQPKKRKLPTTHVCTEKEINNLMKTNGETKERFDTVCFNLKNVLNATSEDQLMIPEPINVDLQEAVAFNLPYFVKLPHFVDIKLP